MSTWLKILVTLGLVLPLGAFVAGSLAASGADDPAPRETIVIRDSPTGSPSRSASPHTEPSHAPSPSDGPSTDDHGGPEVVTPSLDDLGDDHGGDRHGGHGGHGSDDSGSSHGGHGSDDSGGGGHG